MNSALCIVAIAVVGAVAVVGCDKTTTDKVPAVAKATIEKVTSGGTIKEIETEQHHGKVVYEVEYVKDGEKKEIHVAEDGTIVTSANKKDDDK